MAKKTTKTTDTSNSQSQSQSQSSNNQDQHIDVSIVIPVYNEEGIISAALADLTEKLRDVDFNYEIIIAENGSKIKPLPLQKTFHLVTLK